MKERETLQKINYKILSGEHKLPFAGRMMTLQNGTCYVPEKPDRINIYNVREAGKGYLTAPRGSYDVEDAIKNTRELMRYVNSDLLKQGQIDIEYVDINGQLTMDGRLDSLVFDNRIKIRPVGFWQKYRYDARVEYNELSQQIQGDCRVTARNVGLDVRDLDINLPLQQSVGHAGRRYVLTPGKPIQVERFPLWVNTNATGIEKEARVPLHFLSSLLEPYTSERIRQRANELGERYSEEIEEVQLIGKVDEKRDIEINAKMDISDVIDDGLCEEKAVVGGIVKTWLNRKGHKADDVAAWEPFPEDPRYDSKFASEIQRELRRASPAQIVKFYCSHSWRDWIESDDDFDIDISEIR